MKERALHMLHSMLIEGMLQVYRRLHPLSQTTCKWNFSILNFVFMGMHIFTIPVLVS